MPSGRLKLQHVDDMSNVANLHLQKRYFRHPLQSSARPRESCTQAYMIQSNVHSTSAQSDTDAYASHRQHESLQSQTHVNADDHDRSFRCDPKTSCISSSSTPLHHCIAVLLSNFRQGSLHMKELQLHSMAAQ